MLNWELLFNVRQLQKSLIVPYTYKAYLNICLIIVVYNLMWCCMLLMSVVLENKEKELPEMFRRFVK